MSDRLRVAHVIAGLDPVYGGPSYSVPRLCEALGAAGAEMMLFSVAETEESERDAYCKGYRDCRFAWDYAHIPILRRLRSSQGLSSALHKVASTAHVIHNHGLWLMPNVKAAQAAASGSTPLVISPRGMLAGAALAFSPLKKRAFWHLLQGSAVRRAACFHATSDQEYEDIRRFGLTHPVAIIPNGMDLPVQPARPTAPPSERIVLSLGRIHPKKNLVSLIRAWSKLEAAYPRWQLKIIGPPEVGYDNELRALARALNLARVYIEGPLYGEAKTAAYRDAEIFVLSSLTENFGLTVAEALAAGTPAISTKGAPWSELEEQGCGWWIDHGVEPLAAALASAMALPRETLKEMGEKGRAWIRGDFAWNPIARDMLDVYRWLVRGAIPPSLVRFE